MIARAATIDSLQHRPRRPGEAHIKWSHIFPYGTFPYAAGHLVPTSHGLLVSSFSRLHALDPKDGGERFGIVCDVGPGCPAGYFDVRGDEVLLADLDPRGGQKLRAVSLPSRQVLSDVHLSRHIYNRFISDDDAVYYATYAASGRGPQRMITAHPLQGPASATAGPDWKVIDRLSMAGLAQTGDKVFFGTLSEGRFLAVDKKSGAILWEYSGHGRTFASPILVDQSVIYGDNSGRVYSLNQSTGQLHWEALIGSIVSVIETFGTSGPCFLTEALAHPD